MSNLDGQNDIMADTDDSLRAALKVLEVRQAKAGAEYVRLTEAVNTIRDLLGEAPIPAGAMQPLARPSQPASGNTGSIGTAGLAWPLTFAPGEFFNLTQREAVIKLLRKAGRPLKVIDMVAMLRDAGFAFSSKDEANVYASMYTTLRRAKPEVVKRGKEWGLSSWKGSAGPEEPKGFGAGGGSDEDGE